MSTRTEAHRPPSRTAVKNITRTIRRVTKALDLAVDVWGTDYDRLPTGNRNYILERLNEIDGESARLRALLVIED